MTDTGIPPGSTGAVRAELLRRLGEPAPGAIQLLVGPRQVGKTTLLLEIADVMGDEVAYVAMDGPDAHLPGHWERVWHEAAARAARVGKGVLILDEVQALHGWSARLKSEWDRVRRMRTPLHVVVSGSSALRLGSGSKESLAGRFERLELGHWSAADLARTFRMKREEAIDECVLSGAFPGAMAFRDDARRRAAYVRDSIVEPAIGRDLLALEPVRRPALLRQVFFVALSHAAQIVSLQKLRLALADAGALETIAHYLQLLDAAWLVTPLAKHSERELRRRAAPPKLVVRNQAFLATLQGGAPDPERDATRFGQWVENAVLAHALNQGQQVRYWREEPLDVDGVVDGSWGRWAIEVKTGSFTERDLRGLLEFCRRFPKYRPLVLTGESSEGAARAGVAHQSWRDFLWQGPPG
jgi:predicted AAA+ superfamily ATPase